MIEPEPLRPLLKELVVLKGRRVGKTATMWMFRGSMVKLRLDVMGAMCEEVEFDWPGILLSTEIEEFVEIGGYVQSSKGQYRRIGGQGRHLRFEELSRA